MSNVVLAAKAATDYILVGGACYQLKGQTTDPVTHQPADIQATFDSCDDCENPAYDLTECTPIEYYCVDDIYYSTLDGSCGGAPSWTDRQVMTSLEIAGITFGACIPGDGFCVEDHKYVLIAGPYATHGEALAACPGA